MKNIKYNNILLHNKKMVNSNNKYDVFFKS